jgi:uncharacterized membrane protein
MFEKRHQPLAPPRVFARRVRRSLALGLGLIVVSLAIGMAIYMSLEGLGVVDAFLNAAMLLSGMGPLHVPVATAGKIWAGLYAIYCGFAVLGIAAIIFAPLVHRAMHHFHLVDDETGQR